MAIIDSFPFDWHKSEGQALHATLCQIYPTPKGALYVAQEVGFDPATLFADQPAHSLWRDILDKGANAQLNRKLVETVIEKNSRNPKVEFLNVLLQKQGSIAVDYQPRDASGSPLFISSNDTVKEPEALLFHDDLTLEVGRVPWLIDILHRLNALAPAVCKLHSIFPHKKQYGTAFRISSDLLLTNWHVIGEATNVKAEFGFEDDGKGGGLPSKTYDCDAATIKGDAEYDWAVIAIPPDLDHSLPVIKLSEAEVPVNSEQAFIIQHPMGGRKRVAYARNQITYFDDKIVHYLSDTQEGSSGSPVLNEEGKLVALHHAGGLPQEVAGKQPIVKNEGIIISRITAGLQSLGLELP